MPDVERMHLFGVWFSYFSPWPGYVETAPLALMNRIYNSPQVVTLDELNARPPVITSATSNYGGVQLLGTGPHGASLHLLASTNLARPRTNWKSIGNVTNTGGVFSISDSSATNFPQRFYQIVTP